MSARTNTSGPPPAVLAEFEASLESFGKAYLGLLKVGIPAEVTAEFDDALDSYESELLDALRANMDEDGTIGKSKKDKPDPARFVETGDGLDIDPPPKDKPTKKHNPNHDPDTGEFTSGPGGSGGADDFNESLIPGTMHETIARAIMRPATERDKPTNDKKWAEAHPEYARAARFSALKEPLTGDEKAAIKDYEKFTYFNALNYGLRNGGKMPTEDDLRALGETDPQAFAGLRVKGVKERADEMIGHLDSAFSKSSLGDNLTLYRGVRASAFSKLSKLDVGQTYTDKAYVSMTPSKYIAGTFRGETFTTVRGEHGGIKPVAHSTGGGLIKLRVPAGSRVLGASNNTEVVLDRGYKFKVVGKDDGMITVEVMPNVKKANPNHDELGRFAEGPGGGSGARDNLSTSSTPFDKEEVGQLTDRLEAEMEEVDSQSFDDIEGTTFARLERKYQALESIKTVAANNAIALANPELMKQSLFLYDSKDPDNISAALHMTLKDQVAELKWFGSTRKGAGAPLLRQAIAAVKAAGATKIKAQAKFGSLPYYERAGFVATGPENPLSGSVPIEYKLSKANPNHDELGRFAEGPGAGNSTSEYNYNAKVLSQDDRSALIASGVEQGMAINAFHDEPVNIPVPRGLQEGDDQTLLDWVMDKPITPRMTATIDRLVEHGATLPHDATFFRAEALSDAEVTRLTSSFDAGIDTFYDRVNPTSITPSKTAARDVGRARTKVGDNLVTMRIALPAGTKMVALDGTGLGAFGTPEYILPSRQRFKVVSYDPPTANDKSYKVRLALAPRTRKYNPNHDELGRFSSGPGGGGTAEPHLFNEPGAHNYEVEGSGNLKGYTPESAASATELFNRTYSPNYTVDELVALTGNKDKIAETETKLANAGPDTQTQYRDANGIYSAERQAMHEEILRETFDPAKITAATPPTGEKPTLYVLGGRAGAGKSWFSKSPDSPFDAGKTIYINTDDYKEALPEYQGWNAALVHEESADIAATAHDLASRAGLNVTFDATLRSSGTITRLIDQYEKAGYKIEGYFMHTAPQVSTVRALNRFTGPTGRYVPPQYVLGSTGNEKVFDSLTPKFSKYAVYDNNSSSGPKLVLKG